MSDFKFVNDLPATGQSVGRPPDKVIVRFADTLKSRPKQWAMYPKRMSTSSIYATATKISHHKQEGPAPLRHGFEAAVRQGILYVRYVGEDAS